MADTPIESTRAKWLLKYREFESLELPVREFCAERGINYYTFKSWQATFRKNSAGVVAGSVSAKAFRELTPISAPSSAYTITLRCGRRLSIESSYVESRLRKLIEILESC